MLTLALEIFAGYLALSLGAVPAFVLFGRYLARNEERAVEAYEVAYGRVAEDSAPACGLDSDRFAA